MKGKTFENWRRAYNDITKDYIKNVFNKYKSCKAISDEMEEKLYSININYENVNVQGGYNDGQALQRKIESKADADKYCKDIENIMSKLPAFYKKIIINSFIREQTDIQIYMDLGVPERSYYRLKGEAIRMVVDELIANNL